MNREIYDQLSLLTVELLEEPGYLKSKQGVYRNHSVFFF